MRSINNRLLLTTALLLTFGATFAMAEPTTTYEMPPKAIADLIDAPQTPAVMLSPTKDWMIQAQIQSLTPISELAQPELRLAGMRINPRTNGPSRAMFYVSMKLVKMSDLKEREVRGLPDGAKIGGVRWSPDGKRFAFTITTDTAVHLWAGDVESATVKQVTPRALNGASGAAFGWMSDNASLHARLLVEGRKGAPDKPVVPAGPNIQENTGKKAPNRTYQDLLANPYDESMFDHYVTSQAAIVSLDGKIQPIGEAGIVTRVDPSPDAKFVYLETVHRPYSYIVPMGRFPKKCEVFDRGGKMVRSIVDLPLADDIPVAFDAVRKGPRSVSWRADLPSTLVWFEAQDGGDPAVEAAARDKALTLSAPFAGDPAPLWTTEMRAQDITWGTDKLALLTEWRWKDRKTKTWIVEPGNPSAAPKVLWDRSFEDRYNDPGSPEMRITPQGTMVILTVDNGQSIFLSGDGASTEGDRPFLDKLNLATKESKRLWRSEAPYYEYSSDIVDPQAMVVLTRRESVTEPPNFYLRKLGDKAEPKAITSFPHPTPQLKDVYKEQIRYERADGVKLTGTLYLPPGKKPADGPFPMLMWAYPTEFKSADAAGQVTDSPYRFVRTGTHSPLLWLVHGYAVFDDPSLPIVGEGDVEPNDTYVKQLVDGAQAAVDEMVKRGVADRDHIGVGGHSYGAFMTANLLAHCDLFRAGIARSGAYNRTLTPFGFQSEERTFWQAPETYVTMSPFTHAEKVNEPILLIHGEADNNPGTFTVQTERFYQALKGHGAIARMVLLPHESHGYQARESIMHMAAEMTRWLDMYVRDAKPRESTDAKAKRVSRAD